MLYQRCKKAELEKFIIDRGLRVDRKRGREPYIRDYIKTLKQADRDRKFRFLDLPAELRNYVSEKLLTLEDSFFCFPQILCASKQIHEEATGLLYGLNFIDVKIYSDGVYAHGQRCGTYLPTRTYHILGETSDLEFTGLQWPSFLNRARYLRVIVPDDKWPLGFGRHWDHRLEVVSNTVYSLCQTLRSSTCLRSLRMVIQPKPTATFEGMQNVFYAFRLLGDLILELVDKSGCSLTKFYVGDGTVISEKSVWEKWHLLYDCVSTTTTLRVADQRIQPSPGFNFAQAMVDAGTSAHLVSSARDGHLLHWPIAYKKAVVQLRKTLETRVASYLQLDPQLLLTVYRLLRTDIDLRCQVGDQGE